MGALRSQNGIARAGRSNFCIWIYDFPKSSDESTINFHNRSRLGVYLTRSLCRFILSSPKLWHRWRWARCARCCSPDRREMQCFFPDVVVFFARSLESGLLNIFKRASYRLWDGKKNALKFVRALTGCVTCDRLGDPWNSHVRITKDGWLHGDMVRWRNQKVFQCPWIWKSMEKLEKKEVWRFESYLSQLWMFLGFWLFCTGPFLHKLRNRTAAERRDLALTLSSDSNFSRCHALTTLPNLWESYYVYYVYSMNVLYIIHRTLKSHILSLVFTINIFFAGNDRNFPCSIPPAILLEAICPCT